MLTSIRLFGIEADVAAEMAQEGKLRCRAGATLCFEPQSRLNPLEPVIWIADEQGNRVFALHVGAQNNLKAQVFETWDCTINSFGEIILLNKRCPGSRFDSCGQHCGHFILCAGEGGNRCRHFEGLEQQRKSLLKSLQEGIIKEIVVVSAEGV